MYERLVPQIELAEETIFEVGSITIASSNHYFHCLCYQTLALFHFSPSNSQ
jgi:hypothetical protein